MLRDSPFRLLSGITTFCALSLATTTTTTTTTTTPTTPTTLDHQHEHEARGLSVASKGFVTFPLVKKPLTSSKFKIDDAPFGTSRGVSHDADGSVQIQDGYTIDQAQESTAKHGAGIDQDGTDFSYFAEVKLGSAGRQLYMLLDTGASTTWVMGSSCTSKSCLRHNTFGPDDSQTYNDTGVTFNVEYGTGSVKGDIIMDTLSLAGLSVALPFGVANTASDQFLQFPFDGILGMSTSDDTWLSAVAKANLVSANVFGVSLSRSSDHTNDGEIIFGGTDPDKFTGEITYTPVKANSAWTIPLDDVVVGGKAVGLHGGSAYIDTGTSFIFGPPDDVKAIYKLIPGANSSDGSTYTVPCDADSKIAFTFSGKSWTVSTEDIVSPPSDGVCTGNIFGMEYIAGGWLIGDAFLKNVYSVFDVDKGRIGFAAKAVSKTTTPSITTTTSPMGTSAGPSLSAATASNISPEDAAAGLNGHETPSATSTPAGQPTVQGSSGGKLKAGRVFASLLSVIVALAI